MSAVVTIGLDIAKQVFQVHGVDAEGAVVVRRKLRRGEVHAFFERLPPCLIGLEACATSHHCARVLSSLGHDVRLMPAAYVKPYVKRQKNDAADAEAICAAVTRPTMRFVPMKSEEQQGILRSSASRALCCLPGGVISAKAVLAMSMFLVCCRRSSWPMTSRRPD